MQFTKKIFLIFLYIMGCECKNDDNVDFSGNSTTTINNKVQNFLLRKNKFSLIGLFLYVFLLPIFMVFVIPMVVIILFNKIVLGKNTDIIKLMAFTKKNKPKKIKK